MSVWNKQITASMTAKIHPDLILVAVMLAFRFLTRMEELVMVSLIPKISSTINYHTCSIYQILMSVVMVLTTVNKYATTHMEPTTVSATMVMNWTVMGFHVQVSQYNNACTGVQNPHRYTHA